MAAREPNPKVDFFFKKANPSAVEATWHKEFEKLRMIILDCGLTEELKWGQPCYVFQKSNIVLIHGFKEYCAVLFFKGSLLKDPHGILIQQTKNVQVPRQVRFTNVQQIVKIQVILKAYVYEAIEIEKSGVKANLKKTSEFAMADEFKSKLNKSAALKTAFQALTPGRQRGYLLYFSAAKQSQTRIARIEKCVPLIRKGRGLND